MSDVSKREEWRKISVISDVVIKQISGLKTRSYLLGLEALVKHIKGKEGK